MQEIKITRAQTLKEKPESSTLVFGKSMTDHMFMLLPNTRVEESGFSFKV